MSITNKFYIIENNELDSFTEEEKEIAEVVYLDSFRYYNLYDSKDIEFGASSEALDFNQGNVHLESSYFSGLEYEEAVKKMFKDLEEKNPKRLDYQNEELSKFGTTYKVIKEGYDGTLTIKRVYTWATLEYKIHAAKLKD